ncbi:MAG: DUF4129 domain-containing protein [Microcella sp.]|uniref:DUF4129 domain-containing protein n=1 Tax=Microcella sp. TaxID=1913979 RepID=UPI0033156AA9
MTRLLAHARVPRGRAPLEPDAPDARDLLLEELSDPAYAETQPTWFDLLSQAVLDWFGSWQLVGGGGPPALALVVIAVLLAAGILIAILLYGLPRWRRRSTVAVELFGETDRRTARELRRDAEKAASGGDWATAIAERYRATARALDERTIVSVLPGTTGHGFARAAAARYPELRTLLETAADRFDDVRYLGQEGDAAGYAHVRDLDERLERSPAPLARATANTSGSAGGGTVDPGAVPR